MQVIPNEESWVAITTVRPVDLAAPTIAELTAATDLTDLLVSLNATTTGNTIPTPRLKRRFETSTAGTAAGSFSADFYRDPPDDDAWVLLPRGTVAFVYVSRFGGTGPEHRPAVGQSLEVWPIEVSSRAGSNMASNTVQTFTVTGAVPEEPVEDAVVAA